MILLKSSVLLSPIINSARHSSFRSITMKAFFYNNFVILSISVFSLLESVTSYILCHLKTISFTNRFVVCIFIAIVLHKLVHTLPLNYLTFFLIKINSKWKSKTNLYSLFRESNREEI